MLGEARIRRIGDDQLDELIAAQNEIFSDYIIPMRISREFFLDFVRSTGGKVSNVHVATDGGKIVGYVNPVIDRGECWIGGVGVAPTHRRKGIAQRLMTKAEEFASEQGVHMMSLEVIEGNEKAHGLYRKLGYSDSRTYITAEGRPAQFGGYGVNPQKASMSEVLALHERSYADTCWQRRKIFSIVQSARGAECYKVDGGFVLVRKIDANGFIPYLGVVPEMRGKGIGTSLAKFALNRLYELGAFKVVLYNVNQDEQTIRLLDHFDFGITMKQLEMRKSI
jgi:ribosomal protein S18 acetylase RimI-like enzyme